jgi:hypothetical protein
MDKVRSLPDSNDHLDYIASTVICAFSGWLDRGGIILSTVPGMVVLGVAGVREVSIFSSAILADLEMRGFAISFLTPSRVVFSAFAMSVPATISC